MIFALLAILFFGSGDSSLAAVFDRVEARIGETVKDRARRKELLAIADDAKDATKAYAKSRREILDDWIALGEHASSTDAEYRALVERLRTEAAEYEATMIRHRFALKSKMTREEWTATFSVPAPVPVRLADLVGTTWTCTRIEGLELPEGSPPTLEVRAADESGVVRIAGFAGVNRFGGTANAVGAGLAFGPMTATRMAGAPERMELERAYLGSFHAIDKASMSGDTLVLLDGQSVVVTFTRTQP
jgi:heat shock protein HslJ